MLAVVDRGAHGVVVYVHDLTEPVADVTALPEDAKASVARFATALGVDIHAIDASEAGWLFDTLMAATDAIGSGGAAPEHVPPAGAPAASPAHEPGPAAVEPPPEAAPAGEGAGQAQAPSAAVAPAGGAEQVQHGPADVNLPPVTEPKAGYEICPRCSGFRTVLEGGAVIVCPQCNGAGEIPLASA